MPANQRYFSFTHGVCRHCALLRIITVPTARECLVRPVETRGRSEYQTTVYTHSYFGLMIGYIDTHRSARSRRGDNNLVKSGIRTPGK